MLDKCNYHYEIDVNLMPINSKVKPPKLHKSFIQMLIISLLLNVNNRVHHYPLEFGKMRKKTSLTIFDGIGTIE